jgi:hypothetical protein
MTVDWKVYEIYDPEVDKPLAEVSRREARRHFERLMADREQRIAELRKLVAAAGIDLDDTDESKPIWTSPSASTATE